MKNNNSVDKIHKEIIINHDTGKHYLINNNNECTQTNIFGKTVPKFYKNFSGFANYSQRIKKSLINPISKNMDNSIYHPQGIFMEGYFQFPRPKVAPFQNLKKKNNSALINEFKNSKIFSLDSNKKLLNLKLNQGIHYLSSSISVKNNKGKKILISLINETIALNKNKEKKLLKSDYSNEEIKGLKSFKNKLLINNDDMIYGRKLKKPDAISITNYKINQKVMFDNSINRMSKFKKNYSVDSLFKKDIDLNNSFINNIHKSKSLINNCEKEKRLLKGFLKKKQPNKGIFQLYNLPKLPMNGDLYKNDLELIKKVNPIFIEGEIEKEEKDKILFEKKRNTKLVFEKLKIKKNK